jgi:hypothetical protein
LNTNRCDHYIATVKSQIATPFKNSNTGPSEPNKRVQFGYGLNYLIDIEYAVIVEVEATPARTYDEVAATKTMIKRTDERLGLKPERLAADTAYGTGKFLDWVIGSGITPHIPVWDMSKREEGILSRADFTFDRASATSTSALRLSFSGRLGRCTMAGPSSIVRAPATAAHVSSSPNALRT